MQMDIGLSAPDDVNNSHQLYICTLESSNGVTEDFSVNELENGVTEFRNIQEGVPGSKSPKCESKEKDEATEKDGTNAIKLKESTHSPSLHTAPKPVSAMKGSREKRGVTPLTKLTVKWAPDVYDPIPTTVSHTMTNNRPHRQSKKNSKNKHKNGAKSSSRTKHKDKKQTRKRSSGSSSNTGFKSSEHEEEEPEAVVDYCEPPSTSMECRVGNPDQFCGSSFLERYGRSLHLSSVAEAT